MSKTNDKAEEKKPNKGIIVILSYVVSFIANLFYAFILFIIEIIAKLLGKNWSMDKLEAKNLIEQKLNNYRSKPFDELVKLIDETKTYEITGASGTEYQVDIYALWDDKKKEHLRVCGSIDDGWRAYSPLGGDFIISPSGDFIGENKSS
ncbi:hypothetical protein ACFL1G_02895 [Planctomycetota bacterium]